MPKYVCDYETVKEIGKNLCNTAGSIINSAKEYSTKINSSLSDWNSVAKNSFTNVNKSQVATTAADAQYTDKLGEFIQVSAEAIEKLDETLASSIKI